MKNCTSVIDQGYGSKTVYHCLPHTGNDLSLMVVVGIVLLLLGIALLVSNRRGWI